MDPETLLKKLVFTENFIFSFKKFIFVKFNFADNVAAYFVMSFLGLNVHT